MLYPVFNAHSDYSFKVYHEKRKGNENHLLKNYLPLMKKGGVLVEVLQVGGDFFLPAAGLDGSDTLTCLKILECNLAQIRANPKEFDLILNAGDLEAVKKSGRRCIIFSMEGAKALTDDPALLTIFYELGLRAISLTHNHKNIFADGCIEGDSGGGLSVLGIDLLKRINNLNIVLDLVHIHPKGFFQALEIYEKPPIVSHSNANTIVGVNHFRNLTDEQITAVGERGGVIGVNFMSDTLKKDPSTATPEHVVDNIEYIAGLTGIEHVGLGPDFIEYFLTDIPYVKGLETPAGFPLLIQILEKRGFSKSDIKKIGFDNFTRVFKQVLK